MKITLAFLLAGLLGAPALASANPCASNRALEKPLRLSILPTNGSAPIELLLRYVGCRTTDYEPLMGTPTPPTATRTYRADGIAWEADLATPQGEDWTDLYLFYVVPGVRDLMPVTLLKEQPTAAVFAGRVDWGTNRLINQDGPKFDFQARVVTQ
ncbi:hypothetical protein EPO15_05570 [bacterium]|nr:MAG: hypothetical protein EPO15_05570 [bacterium]